MKRSARMISATLAVLVCSEALGETWDTVVLRDDFDSSVVGMPDPGKWVVNNPESWEQIQGRTYLPRPFPWLSDRRFPRVEAGRCVIEHHLFNSFDPGAPFEEFLGGEIHTVLEFEPNRPYRFEARVKLGSDLPYSYTAYPDGLIASFFLYGFDGTNSDEIDFEFLSNQMNDDATYPDGDPLLTNTWDESTNASQKQKPQCHAPGPDELVLTNWNTFRIYWYPEVPQIEWTWVVDPEADQEVLLREETANLIPDEPMALYFNFWASPVPWDPPCDPYDPLLVPVSDSKDDEVSAYEIDYVEVRTSIPLEPPHYADQVVVQTFGDCGHPDTSCLYTSASRALGLPDWQDYAADAGEWWKASPGEGGEFVVWFSRAKAVDGPGSDLRFWQGNGAGGETATVSVSDDCVTFEQLGLLHDDVHTGGDPAPTSQGYYVDFDFAGIGLDFVRCVKVVDSVGDVDGSDIDAIEALHVPEPSADLLAVTALAVLGATIASRSSCRAALRVGSVSLRRLRPL